MLTLSSHFDLLLQRIEPAEARLKIAQEVPDQVRTYLNQIDTLRTCDPHTRLAGSYARHVAINDIKDVDLLVFIHDTYREQSPSAVLNTLCQVLKDLPQTLGDTGTVKIRNQRRSVNVHFDTQDFDLDVVPVIIVTKIDEPLLIPARDLQEWKETNSIGYQQWLSDLNQAHGRKVVPLIKLMKQWRDCHFIYKRPKSYWLECMVVRHISKGWVETEGVSFAALFTNLLMSISTRYKDHLNQADAVPRIPDPMLGNNVAWNWERGHFETFMRRIEESRAWAVEALNQDGDQVAAAVALWQKVFKDTFPTTAEVEAHKLVAAAKAGGLYVNAQGNVTATPPTDTSAWQSPPHRFYGAEVDDPA